MKPCVCILGRVCAQCAGTNQRHEYKGRVCVPLFPLPDTLWAEHIRNCEADVDRYGANGRPSERNPTMVLP